MENNIRDYSFKLLDTINIFLGNMLNKSAKNMDEFNYYLEEMRSIRPNQLFNQDDVKVKLDFFCYRWEKIQKPINLTKASRSYLYLLSDFRNQVMHNNTINIDDYNYFINTAIRLAHCFNDYQIVSNLSDLSEAFLSSSQSQPIDLILAENVEKSIPNKTQGEESQIRFDNLFEELVSFIDINVVPSVDVLQNDKRFELLLDVLKLLRVKDEFLPEDLPEEYSDKPLSKIFAFFSKLQTTEEEYYNDRLYEIIESSSSNEIQLAIMFITSLLKDFPAAYDSIIENYYLPHKGFNIGLSEFILSKGPEYPNLQNFLDMCGITSDYITEYRKTHQFLAGSKASFDKVIQDIENIFQKPNNPYENNISITHNYENNMETKGLSKEINEEQTPLLTDSQENKELRSDTFRKTYLQIGKHPGTLFFNVKYPFAYGTKSLYQIVLFKKEIELFVKDGIANKEFQGEIDNRKLICLPSNKFPIISFGQYKARVLIDALEDITNWLLQSPALTENQKINIMNIAK